MRALPELFAFLAAASAARRDIFSCWRIKGADLSNFSYQVAGNRRSNITGQSNHPTEHRVAARTSHDAPAHSYCSAPHSGICQNPLARNKLMRGLEPNIIAKAGHDATNGAAP